MTKSLITEGAAAHFNPFPSPIPSPLDLATVLAPDGFHPRDGGHFCIPTSPPDSLLPSFRYTHALPLFMASLFPTPHYPLPLSVCQTALSPVCNAHFALHFYRNIHL
jgi:hypothetical protein